MNKTAENVYQTLMKDLETPDNWTRFDSNCTKTALTHKTKFYTLRLHWWFWIRNGFVHTIDVNIDLNLRSILSRDQIKNLAQRIVKVHETCDYSDSLTKDVQRLMNAIQPGDSAPSRAIVQWEYTVVDQIGDPHVHTVKHRFNISAERDSWTNDQWKDYSLKIFAKNKKGSLPTPENFEVVKY